MLDTLEDGVFVGFKGSVILGEVPDTADDGFTGGCIGVGVTGPLNTNDPRSGVTPSVYFTTSDVTK